MNLTGEKVILHKDKIATYEFLSSPKNYEQLMPDNIKKFELNDEGGFLFQLKGMPAIPLKLNERNPHDKVVWGSANKSFDFTLATEITEISSSESEVQIVFNGDFNPMIGAMVKKPLKKLISTLSENLKSI